MGAAESLIDHPQLADLLGERHRIIANDWQAAFIAQLNACLIKRSLAILEAIDFTPAALRTDLAGDRRAAGYLFSASERIDRAADLGASSAALVHENERRWRIFRQRVEEILGWRQLPDAAPSGGPRWPLVQGRRPARLDEDRFAIALVARAARAARAGVG